MLFSFNSSLLYRCFCMFKWLGFELCLEFFILPILHSLLYYTVYTVLYSTAKSAWGVGQKYSTSALKRLFMLGSLSSWNDRVSLKYIQCFLLMSRDFLPNLWLVQKDDANFWLAQSTVLISYWMQALTSREVHILTWIYKLRGQSCKRPLHSSTLLCLLSPPCLYFG